MYVYKASVIDVYDGDTITALVDLGFHIKMQIKVRLYGINTPEITGITRPAGLRSKERVVELIHGKDVILKTYKDKQEKFGRWLADVYVDDVNTKSINQLLVEEGLATPFMLG